MEYGKLKITIVFQIFWPFFQHFQPSFTETSINHFFISLKVTKIGREPNVDMGNNNFTLIFTRNTQKYTLNKFENVDFFCKKIKLPD